MKEGTSAVLLQSGLDEKWWADSMEYYTYLRNIQDLLSDGKTPYERRFGEPFKGPITPFGAMIVHGGGLMFMDAASQSLRACLGCLEPAPRGNRLGEETGVLAPACLISRT